MAKQNYEEKYTDPQLRAEIKEEIKASGKGGKEGQWSARKSQLLTQEYEKRGGGAWENMSEEEKKETETKKREGSKKGQQCVSNTEEAKRARKNAKRVPINDYDELSVGEIGKKIKGLCLNAGGKDQVESPRDACLGTRFSRVRGRIIVLTSA